MKAGATKISFKGIVQNRSDSRGKLIGPGDFIIVKRGIARLLILRCPCGCGDDLLINLDKRSGRAWRLYSKSGSYTLYPSYWRDSKCGSHFIIWNNLIHWCYSIDEPDNWKVNEEIENIVLEALKENEFMHHIELADECGLIPWESLQACRQLSKKGLCIRGKGKSKGCFKRSASKI